jgi:hypothetical protein
MANPFQVTPPNVLQALLMGQQGFDTGRKSMQDAAMSEAGRLYAAGDVKGAQAAASRGGSLQALMGFANLQNNDRDYAFRQTEAQRAQQNADRGFGLQEKQVNATLGNSAASQALARAQFEFMKRPEVRDVNGVPMLVNRETGTMAPIGGMPAAPANIPAGVDPATYKREQAQAAVKSETENKALTEGGQGVLAMVDQLERKISSPSDPKVAQKFGAATGPFVAAASEASTWDPRKWAYEIGRTNDSKAYLDQIKQDAQAINSTMQRALLKGGGAISDSERASINQILGQIAAARSPEDAKALLGNFRGIVRQMFKLPDAGQPGASPQPTPAGNLPPLPPGFVPVQ